MTVTTISVMPETAERLEEYRADAHGSWDETLNGMMSVLPPVEEVEVGCANCDDDIWFAGTVEETGGVIRFSHTEYDDADIFASNYYCSAECAMEAAEEMEKMVPEEPDEVLVGGKSEMQASFEDATFYLDRDTREVGIPVPGAFAGSDSHGNDYDYIGEPVYIREDGDIVQKGVIEDIIHEETHTALMLGHDHETVMRNHPDPDKREEYKEQHAKWVETECAQCGTGFKYVAEEVPDECPDCGASEW